MLHGRLPGKVGEIMTDPFGDLEVNDNVVEIKTPAKKEKEAVGDNTGITGTIKGGGGYE